MGAQPVAEDFRADLLFGKGEPGAPVAGAHRIHHVQGDFGDALKYRTAEGAMIPASDYLQAQRARRHLAAEMDALFDDFDVLITASLFRPAPPLERKSGGPRARQPNPTA